MPLIKRYANRKLYNTQSGQYVTLEDVAEFVRRGEEVRVVDHLSGRDLTSLTLMQILFQEEKKLGELLPRAVLTYLIRTGDETLEAMRERLLAAFDPQGMVDDEIRRRVENLVLEKKLAASEASRMLDLLLDPAHRWESARFSPGRPPDEPQSHEPDLQKLMRQVEQLEQELESLRQNL